MRSCLGAGYWGEESSAGSKTADRTSPEERMNSDTSNSTGDDASESKKARWTLAEVPGRRLRMEVPD